MAYLGDELVVGPSHGHRAEKGLKVVRELAATPVLFARRVEGHEDAGVQVHIDISAQKPDQTSGWIANISWH